MAVVLKRGATNGSFGQREQSTKVAVHFRVFERAMRTLLARFHDLLRIYP